MKCSVLFYTVETYAMLHIMDKHHLASHLDLANHHANATIKDIKHLCEQVVKYGFNGAFVNPCYVSLAKSFVGHQAKVGTVISFPLGQDTTEIKVSSSIQAVKDGADELDIVPNNSILISGVLDNSRTQLNAIVTSVRDINKETVIKFILETGDLSPLPEAHPTPEQVMQGNERIKTGARLVLESGADFVKICTGMGRRGPSLMDVALVKEVVSGKIKIKVAGGITTYTQAKAFLDAGVDRIGTSHAVEILKETERHINS